MGRGKYLFFDAECCDGRHICSLGYVICDENLEIVEKQDLLINPEKPFSWHVVKKLALPRGAFFASQKFPDVAGKIADLFSGGLIALGWSVSNDYIFLQNACARYGLQFIENAEFYDVQTLFMTLLNAEQNAGQSAGQSMGQVALERAMQQLFLPPISDKHKSDDDAEMTMHVLKKLCAERNVTAKELLDSCKESKGYIRDGVIKVWSFNQKRLFKDGIARFTPTGAPTEGPLVGKRILFDPTYEKTEPLRLWTLQEKLMEAGATCTAELGSADIFIPFAEMVRPENLRRKAVLLSIDRLCETLGTKYAQIGNHETDGLVPIGAVH